MTPAGRHVFAFDFADDCRRDLRRQDLHVSWRSLAPRLIYEVPCDGQRRRDFNGDEHAAPGLRVLRPHLGDASRQGTFASGTVDGTSWPGRNTCSLVGCETHRTMTVCAPNHNCRAETPVVY